MVIVLAGELAHQMLLEIVVGLIFSQRLVLHQHLNENDEPVHCVVFEGMAVLCWAGSFFGFDAKSLVFQFALFVRELTSLP